MNGKLKSPKLRGRAGESRGLIPCQLLLARQFLDASKQKERTMILASEHLNNMCSCLSKEAWDPAAFANSIQKFLLFNAALEVHFLEDKLFRVKPKSHQLIELRRKETNPIYTWNYRDESFGHYLSTLAKRRGGNFSMQGVSSNCLQRFLAANKVPPLMGDEKVNLCIFSFETGIYLEECSKMFLIQQHNILTTFGKYSFATIFCLFFPHINKQGYFLIA